MAKKKAKKARPKKTAKAHHPAKKILSKAHPDILKEIIRRLGG